MVSANRMVVEVWSDVMCPFCYLGKQRFGQALARFAPRADVTVVWRSFQLQPGLRTDPAVRIQDFLARSKGIDPAAAKQMNEQVAAAGREAGLAYDFDRLIVANTFDAHRLMHLARASGRQDAAAERLFRAQFSEGRNVDDPATLLAIGEEIGLERNTLAEVLASDAYAAAVNEDIADARELGIQGVPFFVFDRKYAVSGAQSAALFLEVLEKAHAEWREREPAPPFDVVEGDACTSDGKCR